MIGHRTLFAVLVTSAVLVIPAGARADFGLVPGSFKVTAENRDGTVDLQASSHPYSFTVHFDLKTAPGGHTEGGALRDVLVNLPPSFVGNPRAVARCPRQEFEGIAPSCPPSTAVGVLHANVVGNGEIAVPIYNLAPPPGQASQFGSSVINLNAFQNASVRTEDGYGITVTAPNIPKEITSVTETIWGVPADPSHDAERGGAVEQGPPIASDAPLLSFLTLPASCQSPQETTLELDSKLNPGVFVREMAETLDSGGNPAPMSGCEAVPFQPKIASQPTTRLASNPSGLDFELKLPNQGLLSPGGITETEPRKAVVTLPEGVSINPSLAEGVGICSQAQYKSEQIDSPAGAGCPEASKLGSVIAQSPLLEEPIEGSLYLAAPYENPFGSLGALYMVARAPERGILVKQAGKVEFDSETGQITTTFENLPPLPFSSFKLHFREGARAPLATPSACGEYQTVSSLTPFSAKDDSEALTTTAAFQIERGADGGACPTAGLPPFRPGLIAGSINNAAGRFSPFNLRLFRTDAEQEINRFSIKLPPGVVANLAGVPFCSEAQIAAATARTGPHGGQEELEAPSCPTASEIGHSLAGAGVGSALAYAPGKIYLAGPYHGSAISIAAITAAKVGPFDLGTVVVRQALRVNTETGEVFIDATGSDPIPHIIAGVPVHLRDIRAYVDRPEFVLNPSSCETTSTASTLLGSGLDFASEADNNPVVVSTRFQAADCAALPFKPKLGLRLKGSTKRGGNPSLTTHLAMNGFGEAGLAYAQVALPRSEFLDNSHIGTVCTRVQFRQGEVPGENCPAASVYGHASARTPILDAPLEGPIYLRSSEHKLPDLVLALHHAEINVSLVGRVDSVKGGGLRNTFEFIPDAPVTSADLIFDGAAKGLLENSTNICKGKHLATVKLKGHNGKVSNYKAPLKASCAKKHKKSKRRRRGR
jgi:hypothetical protein